jgi:hypothetical protein
MSGCKSADWCERNGCEGACVVSADQTKAPNLKSGMVVQYDDQPWTVLWIYSGGEQVRLRPFGMTRPAEDFTASRRLVRPMGAQEVSDLVEVASAEEPAAPPASDNVFRPIHYARFAIEPITFIIANGLDFLTGNVIKYTMRHDAKNGLEDLKKARRYIDLMIEREERKQRGEVLRMAPV